MIPFIIWCGMMVIITLLIITDTVNRTSKHVGLIVVLTLICICAGVFIIIPFFTSYRFYNEYVFFQQAISSLTPSQEYICLDDAIVYRRQLIIYQTRMEQYGNFAPYYSKLKDLYPIELINYNLENFG